MTEKRYTLITIAPIEHGKPTRLQFEVSTGIGQLLCSQPSRLRPGESVLDAHDDVKGFNERARPGDLLLGLDQAIVCESTLAPDQIANLEAEVASLRAQLAAKRPRLFEFANGSEIDVDRYLALDATAREHVATFQLHHGYHRVFFDSDEQRATELERMRAFRDGRAS
jgi:hypothetical protein